MGLGAGGLMRQTIETDPYKHEDWDTRLSQKFFVSHLHAKDWLSLTGEPAPNVPPTAQEYSAAELPWFEWYGADQPPLPGGKALAGLRSVGTLHKDKTGAELPHSQDVEMVKPIFLD